MSMAESVVLSQFTKLHLRHSLSKEKRSVIRDSHCRISYRYKVLNLPTWEWGKLGGSSRPHFRDMSLRLNILGSSLVSSDGLTVAEVVSISDQVLLAASILLTYLAGVISVQKSSSSSQSKLSQNDDVPESSSSSGSARENGGNVSLRHDWDVIKGKLLDSIDAIEQRSNFGNGIIEHEQHSLKRPLSLYAVSEGPKIRLLWASLQQLEKEVTNIPGSPLMPGMDDWMAAFSEVILKSYKPVCIAWMEKELCLENSNKGLPLLIIEKLNGDKTVSQSIRKSGKEGLYAELVYFLRFSSLRRGCCYDRSLFALHGISILEDLVITLADGIASICLELISVDCKLADEINSPASTISNLSTRGLQRLRNEVALNQWLYQNMQAVVSMYEDRFDLCVLNKEMIKAESGDKASRYGWMKKIFLERSESMCPSFCKVVIGHLTIPVKRTKELRALTGWRYYFSLFLEFSDISMPIVRAVIEKVSNAISFFLVSLIGRSLGLIYTGIRQSLRWK